MKIKYIAFRLYNFHNFFNKGESEGIEIIYRFNSRTVDTRANIYADYATTQHQDFHQHVHGSSEQSSRMGGESSAFD